MLKIAPRYRLPLTVSISLHVVVLIALFIHLPAAQFRASTAAKHKPVQAVAVEAKAVEQQVAAIVHQRQKARAKQEAQLRQIKQQRQALAHERMKAQRAKAALRLRQTRLAKAERLAKLRTKQRAQATALAKAQRIAKAKHQRAQLAKLKKAQQALAVKQQQLAEKMLAQQMAHENKALSRMRVQQMQGVLNRYKAQILSAISQRWVVPPGVNKKRSAQFLIQLAPGGVVLNVELLKSSGSRALDRSAEVAIYKASPLPVPKDPAVFNPFRQLRLTVKPLVVLNATS